MAGRIFAADIRRKGFLVAANPGALDLRDKASNRFHDTGGNLLLLADAAADALNGAAKELKVDHC